MHGETVKKMGSQWTDFHGIWYLSIFLNPIAKIQVSLKSDKEKGELCVKTDIHFCNFSLNSSYNEKCFRQKLYTMSEQILCSVTVFSRKSLRLWDNVETDSRAGQAWDDNMAHARIMLDDKGCRHTLRICNTYCLSTTTMVARTRLNVTFILPLRVLFVLITVSAKPLAVFARVLCFSVTLRLGSVGRCASRSVYWHVLHFSHALL